MVLVLAGLFQVPSADRLSQFATKRFTTHDMIMINKRNDKQKNIMNSMTKICVTEMVIFLSNFYAGLARCNE